MMLNFDALQPRFESELATWLRDFHLGEPTTSALRAHFGIDVADAKRGKRLRPRLLIGVTLEESQSDRSLDDALSAACAIEILHNYSLVHDDIEDRDELRHGRPTVWAVHGVAHGINIGDAMCAMSYLAILRAGRIHDAAKAARMAATLHEANLAMCVGQGLDIAFEHDAHVTYDRYLAMIAGKTSALFGAACELGAIAADVSAEQTQAYADLGRTFGTAFQIRDDILGTWGAPDATGKPSGADIRRRKWSFPITWLMSQPPSAERAIVEHAYLPTTSLDDATVASVIGALERAGAREASHAATADALRSADEIARVASIDRYGTLRTVLRGGAQRVA